MKPILLFCILLNSVRCINPDTVYICDSSGATRYHRKANCRGLSNCHHRIIEVTLEEAQKSNRTLCHWEK